MRLLRASTVLVLSVCYLSSVFRFPEGTFLELGLGDWADPYFINFLLEHWHHSVWRLTDPSSPPMYYPARGTLGYSHGLVLYAPFYLLLRLFLDVFQSYTLTLFLVLEVGAVCLYLVLRKCLGLRFVESVLLTAFFVTSPNVTNGGTGVWSQTASVFLIPPILLVGFVSARMTTGRSRLVLAALAGLLTTLLFSQDFYTAQFALLSAALLLPVALLVGGERPHRERLTNLWRGNRPWIFAFALGGFIGGLAFLWIYLRAYLEHPVFPDDQLMNSLTARDPSSWRSALDVMRSLAAYESLRPFKLVAVAALLTWLPGLGVDRTTRLYGLWFVFIAVIVLLVPIRFNELSIWKMLFGWLPGFSVIRDPKRIIYVYELAVALAIGVLLARLPAKSLRRITLAPLLFLLIVTDWNRQVFDYLRPIAAYDRTVKGPIDIDASCQSFFIKGASAEYMSRSNHMWTLYGVDSMFIALNHSIPTLNGYSAWSPEGWELANPQEPTYPGRVAKWIERHSLRDVCELDIEARTMKLHTPTAR